MNTARALAIAAFLLPSTAEAAPLATPVAADGPAPVAADVPARSRWALAVGVGLPAFSPPDELELPPFLVLSAPFREGGVRLEPELGIGSGRYLFGGEGLGVTAPLRSVQHQVSLRWIRLGVTVAPEWTPAAGSSLFLGPRVAVLFRHERSDTDTVDFTNDGLDWQFGAAGGGELALTEAVAVGAALRFGWTVLDELEPSTLEAAGDRKLRRAGTSAATQLGGEALLSVRIAL